MGRKNYLQLLQDRYNISDEFDKITILFNKSIVKHTCNVGYMRTTTEYYTLEQMVEKKFSYWKGRGTCISIQNMRDELGIDSIIKKPKKEENEVVLGLEYYLNIGNLFLQKVVPGLPRYEYSFLNEWNMLRENIDILLDKLCFERFYDKDHDLIFLISKNPAATAVAEISSEDTAMSILMYLHASLKGKLAEKKDILRRIAQEYEPLFDKGIIGFSDYFDKANNMLNNLDIRHNNKAGKKKNDLATSLTNEELENWYDELYQLLLFCILIKDNKDRKDKMAEFLKGLKVSK